MGKNSEFTKGARFLFIMASFVVVVAGMKAADAILVPFILSVFIAIICTPLLFWLKRKGIPRAPAIFLILAGIIVIGALLTMFVGVSVNDFSEKLPVYRERLLEKTRGVVEWLGRLGVRLSEDTIRKNFDPGVAMQLAAKILTSLSSALSNTFFILLTVIFILLEATGIPLKMRAAFSDPEKTLSGLNKFTRIVNQYLVLKTIFSIVTGLAIWIWCAILGVDYAFIWGLLSFFLNYVPNIGAILSAIPAILLALVQLGTVPAMLTAVGFIVVNSVIGNVFETKYMGRGLGLSTLVVFLSLVFWGWVLGPVGMLLSVPLTIIVRIALESNEDTRWIAIMLGPDPKDNLDASSRTKSG
jgi:predicted PurR-regulated permease PerM